MIPEDAGELLKQSAQLHGDQIKAAEEELFEAGTQIVYFDEAKWHNTTKPPISPMCILSVYGAEDTNKGRHEDYFLVFSTGPVGDKSADFARKKAWDFVEGFGLSKEDDFAEFIKGLVDKKQCVQVDISVDNYFSKKTNKEERGLTIVPVRVLGEKEQEETSGGEPPF